MPTPNKGPRLGGSPAHQRHILSNLAAALFEHGRITTTHAKARRLRPVAERLITFAKRGDMHARRQVLTVVPDKSVVHTLFTEIGPEFASRPGGYTRITKIGPRKGDNAPMAVIELVRDVEEAPRARRRVRRPQAPVPARAGAGTAAATATAEADADVAAAEAPEADATETADATAEVAETEDSAAGTEAADAGTEAADAGTEAADAGTEAADGEPEAADAAAAEAPADEAPEAPEAPGDAEPGKSGGTSAS